MKKAGKIALGLCALVAGALGALAGCTALAERDFAAANPPPGKIVEPEGVRIHAISRGEADPPVLVIHGNPGTSLDFSETLLPLLAPKHRAVAIDRPGHGWSGRPEIVMSPAEQARLLHGAAKALGLERPILVGFSYGGPVALAYALDHPADVRAIVLVAALGSPEAGHIQNAVQALLTKPVLGPVMAWTVAPSAAPGEIRKGLERAFEPDQIDPKCLTTANLHWTRPGPMQAAAGDWPGLDSTFAGLAARYGEIKVPVEILPGGGDKSVAAAHGEYLRAHIPGAVLTNVPNRGHMLPYTDPAAIAAAVERAAARAAAKP